MTTIPTGGQARTHRSSRKCRMLSGMKTRGEAFESLLAARARIGWGMSVATPRPSMKALYEFGAGYPDPASFPYDGMAEATARMLKDDGAAAMTYGEPQGYRGLRELICHKYERFEAFKAKPENIIVANGRSDDEVAREIGADKLIYQDLDALVHAAQQVNPKITCFETSCFSGEYITGDISPEYLAFIEAQRRDGARRQKEEATSSNQLDLNLLTVD